MTAQVEYVHLPTAVLRTARQGSGPAMVLCHGGPGLWDYLEPMAGMVDNLVTVYRYDQRACGRSSGNPPFDVLTAIADLEALREHWDVPQWVVGGHSWGATLALAYALQHRARTKGLIYVSGTGIDPAWHAAYHKNRAARMSPEEQRRLAELQEQLSRAQGAEFAALDRAYCELVFSSDLADRSRVSELAGSLLVDGLHVNYEVNRLLGKDAQRFAESDDMRERLAGLEVPTLVIHGEADLRPAWAARTVADVLPHADMRILPGIGHLPWLERPDLLREALRAFLRSI